ncbi:MAG TPA: hypothetical protein VLC09_03620 [Polyangiaceae bacterium]|nr:hypothetical protein [Polyangiaceae bacterium]
MPIQVDPEETFHVLFGQNVREMDLDALDLAYRAEAVDEATLIWQEGLGEWLRLDVVLERLAAQDAAENPVYSMPAPAPAPDVYFVLLGPDDTKQMSIDQLDDAFRLEVIDEATLVWQPGFAEWIRLDQLLAMVDAAVGEAPLPHTSFYPQQTQAPSLYPAATQRAAASVPPRSQPQSYGYVIGRGAESTAPVTHSLGPSIDLDSLEDLRPPAASPWFRRGAFAAAAAAALLIAHRTGLTAPLLPSAVAETASVETPHGVDSFLASLEKQHGLDKLSPTTAEAKAAARPESASAAPVLPAPTTATEPAAEANSQSNPAKSADAAAPTAAPAAAPATEPTTAPAAAAASSPSLPAAPAAAAGLPTGSASKFANSLQGKKPVGATARPTPTRSVTKKATSSSKGSGLAYDPMNGTL